MDLTQKDWSANSKSKPNNVIIDVRTPQEYIEGYIKDAKNINIYDSIFLRKMIFICTVNQEQEVLLHVKLWVS